MSNADVIAFALHDLGGAGSYVDVEDLFVRAHEIAPKRFSWRSKPYPNYKTLYQALVDLERAHPTFLIATDDGLGRQLTASGVAWVRERGPFVRLALEMPSQGMSSRRPWMRLLNELTSSPAVQAFMAGERRMCPGMRQPKSSWPHPTVQLPYGANGWRPTDRPLKTPAGRSSGFPHLPT